MPSQVQRSASKLRAVERQRRQDQLFGDVKQGELLGVGLGENVHIPAAVLKKNTSAVHIANSITAIQRKVYNVLLEHAYDELPRADVKMHKIPIQDLMAVIGFDSKNTGHLKSAIKALMAQTIEWNIIEERGSEVWEASTAIASVRFKDGICQYEFSQILRERLHQPERYAKLDLVEMRPLSTATAIALYENCTRYANVGRTPFMPMETWRRLLGTTASTYEEFKRFNEKQLQPAISQLHRHTRLKLTPQFRRDGRKVTEMQMLIESDFPKSRALQTPAATGELDPVDSNGVSDAYEHDSTAISRRLMSEFCLTQAQAEQVIGQHGEERSQRIADYVAGRFNEGKIQSGKIAGYFLSTSARFEDAPKVSSLEVRQRAQAEERQRSVQRSSDRKADTDAFNACWRGLIHDFISSLPVEDHEQLMETFEDFLRVDAPHMLKAWNDPATRSSLSCQAFLRNYVAGQYFPDKEECRAAWVERGRELPKLRGWLWPQVEDSWQSRSTTSFTA
ncbi:replication initiation protein [Xanthomonas euvesicatoria]